MTETDPGNPCGSCVNACCRKGLRIVLNGREARNLKAADTILKVFLPADDGVDWSDRRYFREHAPDQRKFVKKQAKALEPGQGLYGFESDCGNLVELEDGTFECGVHDDSALKPGACEDFTAGTRACTKLREKVINQMLEEDSLLPSLVGVALAEEDFRALEDL